MHSLNLIAHAHISKQNIFKIEKNKNLLKIINKTTTEIYKAKLPLSFIFSIYPDFTCPQYGHSMIIIMNGSTLILFVYRSPVGHTIYKIKKLTCILNININLQ